MSKQNTQQNTASLILARHISDATNHSLQSGEFMQSLSLVSKDLVRFWFDEEYVHNRTMNFHIGQKQALLNCLYLYEVRKLKNVREFYECFYKSGGLENLDYDMDMLKLCFKMATGTGKTWVMNALVVWQYLNSIYTYDNDVRYFNNFLIIAPGLIVYDRLLDSYKGRLDPANQRDWQSGDIMQNIELFVPEPYRRDIERLLASSVFSKSEEMYFKTHDQIIITNWHFLVNDMQDMNSKSIESTAQPDLILDSMPHQSTLFETQETLEHVPEILQAILPITPKNDSKHDINVLDRHFASGGALRALCACNNLCVINDEAHHLGSENNEDQRLWAKLMKTLRDAIESRGGVLMQCDFSATPFTQESSTKAKKYFPHIIVDFALKQAISHALVKTITLDKRSQIGSLKELDFRAIRGDDDKPIALSDGQKIMIEAGIAKLEILEAAFGELDSHKHPKMMIVCEEKEVLGLVENFLANKGYGEDEVLSIHSGKKNEVGKDEYDRIKATLFGIDAHKSPKFILSVLMLREGFDVSSICVIVALRANQSGVLVEQTIGRGLRLMWRGEEYTQMRKENLALLKQGAHPTSYIDNLFLVEHPAFDQFYEEMLDDGLITTQNDDIDKDQARGDMIQVSLCENYMHYDLYWIEVHKDSQGIDNLHIDTTRFKRFPKELESLKKLLNNGERFVSRDLPTSTQWGEYIISSDLFSAKAYNEYLSKLCAHISGDLERANTTLQVFLQIEQDKLIAALDCYIRTGLFGRNFDPLQDWRTLMLEEVTKHIISEFLGFIATLESHNATKLHLKCVPFSSVASFTYRQKFLLNGSKSIYTHTPFPSNRGGLEERFIAFIQAQAQVCAFIKIIESKHTFAYIPYIRTDGNVSKYFPDFIVRTNDKTQQDTYYLIETKAQKDLKDPNVQAKRNATLQYIANIQSAQSNEQNTPIWRYLLVGENTLDSILERNGHFSDLVLLCEIFA